MADAILDGITTDGMVKVVIVPAIANPAAPTAAELNAATAVDISCLLTADGWALTVDQATIADTRLCDTENYARPGRSTWALEITYVRTEDPDEDLAYNTLVPGYAGFAVQRAGVPYGTAFGADDEVTVVPFTAGKRRQVAVAPNEVFRRVQTMFIRGKVQDDVAVVAA
jgi:hypothetical protein